MHPFEANIQIIGVNPFVFVPETILNSIFLKSGKTKGSIPIFGLINGKDFQQTLVRFDGEWRLYINTSMLKNSPKRIGEKIQLLIDFDPRDRSIPMPTKLRDALDENPDAKLVFENLSPSRQKEIVRYIARLKTEQMVATNVERAISFLRGQGRFVGRDKP